MKKIAYSIVALGLFAVIIYIFLYLGINNQSKAPIRISWQLLANDVEWGICESKITLHNDSPDTLYTNWTIYYCQMSLAPLTLPEEQIHIEQICASYHSLTPTTFFAPLPPHSSRAFVVRHRGSVLRKNGAPQGAYIVFEDANPIDVPIELIASADGHEFKREKLGIGKKPYADGEWLYEQNQKRSNNIQLNDCNGIRLLPLPKSHTFADSVCDIESAILDIHLLGENGALFMCREGWRSPEGYSLTITPDSIHILAADSAGAFYAKQTIRQLTAKYAGQVPCLTLTDYPDLHHRGLMIDIARNFTSKEELFRIIDDMALYKMNVLHLHLTDDEGWRIEIDGLPELTEVGARRGHTLNERECLYPSYNGGWDMNNPASTANGYLTRNDFKEILTYAKDRYIYVVPEVDMPGHMRAAIKSMEARYYKYIDTDPKKATEYLLSDFEDTSVYKSAQYYTDNVLCIALPSVYTFVDKVVSDIQSMYREANADLLYFHIGGDEVPRNAWIGSPICQAYMHNKQLASTYDLKDDFIAHVLEIVQGKNITVMGWEDIAMRKGKANPRFAKSNVISHCWNSVPEWRGEEIPYQLANAGYKVLLGCVTHLYLDMSYLNHEDERGLHWGGYTDEWSGFEFQPYNITAPDRVQLQPKAKHNIIGIQAQLFAETIRSTEQLEDYIYPKLFGVAERAWNAECDSKATICGLEDDLALLAARNRHFHLGQPGIHRVGDSIYMNSSVKDAQIRYTTDGSLVTEKSPLYTQPFVCKSSLIHARSFYLGMKSNTTHSVSQKE